jgi:hypothetical protein
MKSLLFLCALLMSTVSLALSSLTASVDKTTLGLNESLHYTLVAADDNGQLVPNFDALKQDFNILSRSESSQLSIINNKSSQYTQWSLELMPTHTGTLTIPAITLGQINSQPITLQVTAQASTQSTLPQKSPVFIESSVNPKDGYVQGQLIYNMRIYYNRSIRNPALNMEPNDQYIMKHLEPDAQYDRVINGVPYQVLEQRYAIFPQKSGSITIPAPTMRGYTQQVNTQSAWGLDTTWQPFRVSGQAITLNIKAPAQNNQRWWLPASELRVTQQWSQPLNTPITTGSAITRTITLEATGLLDTQLPELPVQNQEHLQIYPDKAITSNHFTPLGVVSKKIIKIAYIPNAAGSITLPAIQIPWWNTKTNQAEIAMLPSQALNIISTSNRQNNSTSIQPLRVEPTLDQTDNNENTAPATSANKKFKITAWFWIANISLVLWLITLLLLLRSKRARRKALSQPLNHAATHQVESIRKARSHLKKMCLENNAKAAKTALLNVAHAIWDPQHFLTLKELATQFTDEKAIEHINALDKHLYTDSHDPWDGLSFWDGVKQALSKKASSQIEKKYVLPNLYLGDDHD